MKQVQGVIDSIYTKEVPTKRGPAQVYHAIIGGIDVNLGFNTKLSQGENVSLNVEHKYGGLQLVQDGQALSTSASQAAQSKSNPNVAVSKDFPVDINSRGTSIVRQNSMGHAVRIVENMILNGVIAIVDEQVYIAKVLEVAYTITDFSTGQREEKQAAAIAAYQGEE